MQPAPGRALLTIGLAAAATDEFADTSAAAGFVVRPTMRADMWSPAPAHPPVGPPCSARAKWPRR